MTLDQALVIHMIHHSYNFQKTYDTLSAFDSELTSIGGFTYELSTKFKSYIDSLKFINNETMLRLQHANHLLTKFNQADQSFMIQKLLELKNVTFNSGFTAQ